MVGLSNNCTRTIVVLALMHVLALDFPQLSKYWEYDLRNYRCCTEPFAVSPYYGMYLDMHGLIFETSVFNW